MEPTTEMPHCSTDMMPSPVWKPEDYPLGLFEHYLKGDLDLLFENATIEDLPVIEASDTEEPVQSQDPQEIPREAQASTNRHISKTGKRYYKHTPLPS